MPFAVFPFANPKPLTLSRVGREVVVDFDFDHDHDNDNDNDKSVNGWLGGGR